MSYHSSLYLNSGNIMVGNTENTGNAWWYNQSLENPALPTHFAKFIPLTTVRDRLFGWSAWESDRLVAYFERPVLDDQGNTTLDSEGNVVTKVYEVPVRSFKAIGREDWVVNGVPDTEEDGADAILHVQGKDYGVHQLQEVFINKTAEILQGADNMVGVVSAGLLKWGRRGWITISIPEDLINDESGLQFRPNLTVSTSFDSSLPTSFTRTFGIPVCDNTLDYQLAKSGNDGKLVIKHTKNSMQRVHNAAEVLGLLSQQADDMNKALADMVKAEVPEELFIKWLDKMIPVPEITQTIKEVKSIQGEMVQVSKTNTNSHTNAMNRRDKLVEMWDRDPRVAPWKNTKLGILQLWNTYNQHERTFKASKDFDGNRLAAKVEANQLKTLGGDFLKADLEAVNAIDEILADVISIPVTTPQGKRSRAKAPVGAS